MGVTDSARCENVAPHPPHNAERPQSTRRAGARLIRNYKRDWKFERYNVPFRLNPYGQFDHHEGGSALCTLCMFFFFFLFFFFWPQRFRDIAWRDALNGKTFSPPAPPPPARPHTRV